MSYHSEAQIKQILSMAVSATETMSSLDIDFDIIKARLKLIREIADGLGIDVKIPNNRALMIKRYLGGYYDE